MIFLEDISDKERKLVTDTIMYFVKNGIKTEDRDDICCEIIDRVDEDNKAFNDNAPTLYGILKYGFFFEEMHSNKFWKRNSFLSHEKSYKDMVTEVLNFNYLSSNKLEEKLEVKYNSIEFVDVDDSLTSEQIWVNWVITVKWKNKRMFRTNGVVNEKHFKTLYPQKYRLFDKIEDKKKKE